MKGGKEGGRRADGWTKRLKEAPLAICECQCRRLLKMGRCSITAWRFGQELSGMICTKLSSAASS